MADEIIVKYQAETKAAEKNLNNYIKTTEKVGTTTDKTTKKVEKDYSKMAGGITTSLKSIAGAVGIAFGTQQIIQFSREAVQLAGKLEGVERAFNKLNKPNLLADLRKATRGTVTDLELMRQAVRAQNFQVPLTKLASFFEFATKRSIETGESVDYLVSSIIDGIGRKSTLVLDNLGISATQLQAEIKKTGDFGEAAANIISRSSAETGEVVDTTAVKVAALGTAFENMQTKFGAALITLGTGLATTLGIIDEIDPKLSGINKAMAQIVAWYLEDLRNGFKSLDDVYLKIEESVKRIRDLTREEEALGTSSNDRKRRAEIVQLLKEEEIRVSALRTVFETYKQTLESVDAPEKEIIKNLKFYNDLIKELKTEQGAANTTRERVRELEDEINEAIRQRLILLGRLREVGGDRLQEIESISSMELLEQQKLTDEILNDYERRNDEIKKMQEDLNKDLAQQDAEYQAEQKALYQDTFFEVANLVAGLAQLSAQKGDQELANLQEQLNQRLISEEEYETKKRQILSEQAEDQKGYAIFQATINTAQAVVAALGSQPFTPANIALAAAVGAAGAVQIGLIASQPTPQFAEGGWVDSKGRIHGRKHGSGGVKIEAEGDEFITRGKYAIPNARLLEAINTGNADKYIMENHVAPIVSNILDGGMGAMGDSLRLNNLFNDKNLLKLGDRNRLSARDDARYIVKELKQVMKPRKRGGYA